jgi:hypothetical protein
VKITDIRNDSIYRNTTHESVVSILNIVQRSNNSDVSFSIRRPLYGAMYRRVLQMYVNRIRYNILLRNLCVHHKGGMTRHIIIYVSWSRTYKILRTISCCSSHSACRYYIVITIVSDKKLINRTI